MQIEIKVDVSENKYGHTLGHAELVLDSDDVDLKGLSDLVTGVVKSAFVRALEKLNAPKPVPVEDVINKATPVVHYKSEMPGQSASI